MQSLQIELDDDLADLLDSSSESLEHAAKELMILELYRRGAVSSGKASEILEMPRHDFIQHASKLGIPVLDLTEEEWEAERRVIETL
jgi:predicted HTH domain antitoxin